MLLGQILLTLLLTLPSASRGMALPRELQATPLCPLADATQQEWCSHPRIGCSPNVLWPEWFCQYLCPCTTVPPEPPPSPLPMPQPPLSPTPMTPPFTPPPPRPPTPLIENEPCVNVPNPVGWCSTGWEEVYAETVECIACASNDDCPGGRACTGAAWCTADTLCGSHSSSGSSAKCADIGGCTQPPPAAPSPPPPPPHPPSSPPPPRKPPAPPSDVSESPTRSVQYFAQWSIYGRGFRPWDVKFDEITHINYAFFDVTQACEVASLDEYADFDIVYEEMGMAWGDGKEHGNIGAFQQLKEQHPHVSILLSLGGWTLSDHFSDCAKSSLTRQTLVASALEMLERTGFDGLDVDWEYPVCCGEAGNSEDADDWENYLLLLAELRAALDEAYPNQHKELTIAMGMGPSVTNAAPKAELAELLDCINLMTYDFNGGSWSTITAHNAPLHPDPAYEAAGGDALFHAEWGVLEWAAAVSPSKLVMGMPAYGRSWYGTKELYAAASGPGPGTYWEAGDPSSEERGILRYDEITTDERFQDFERVWSEPSQVPYLVGTLDGKDAFISFDDAESIAIKAAFAKAKNLAGLMWWEASEDPASVLLLAANEAWRKAPATD